MAVEQVSVFHQISYSTYRQYTIQETFAYVARHKLLIYFLISVSFVLKMYYTVLFILE